MQEIERGAEIIIKKWIRPKPWQRILIVTGEEHLMEAEALKKFALKKSSSVDIMLVENTGIKVGVFFDEHEEVFDTYDVIIGATDYSLVTTRATKRARKRGSQFLSLPLSTNDGKEMLAHDFITVDTKKTKMFAQVILKYLKTATFIHVTSKSGTDLTLYKRKRRAGFFNGVLKDGKGFSSASIEVYVPIEETKSEGIMVVDGSLGYIGKAVKPTKIRISDGKIVWIEETPTGIRLKNYLDSYQDDRILVAGEFGIGLNSKSKCEGKCYIEDESAYGTFHIGFGRNLALGGVHEASGHYDLVCHAPNIYVDNRQIMEEGKIISPEPVIY